jgi:hypothetical protein
MSNIERAEQRRALDEFANAGAQPNQPTPGGHALVRPTTGIAERVIGAQPVAIKRDEQAIMQKLAQIGAMAGKDWFYRFPVRTKEGGQDWIEGPSIKLANDVARIFGNNINEVREVDVGDAWVFYARFTDVETGFSMERAYRQRKSQTSLRTKDADRQQDIAYQIGQSKAIRNAIVNALQLYADFAFDEARNSLVDKIGKDLDGWRKRTVDGLQRGHIDLHRAERAIGRAAKDWLAPDIARLVAMMQAVADGMASIDETFPEKTEDKSAEASTLPQGTESELQRPAAESETKDEQPAAPPKAAPKNFAEYKDYVRATAEASNDADALRSWFANEAQRRLRNQIGMISEETNEARKIIEERIKELRR